jgi:tRNA dimethylallyltransferase
MLLAGLDDEVRQLARKYRLNPGLPSMRCVGYRQVWEAQEGLIPPAELRDRGIFATRQLAKRQITWLTNSFDRRAGRLPRPARVARFLGD